MSGRANITGLLVASGMTLALVGLFARVVQLQLAPSPQLVQQRQERTTRVAEVGVRGDLMDRRGRVLSTTRIGYRVVVDPSLIKPEKLDDTIVKLAAATGAPVEEVGLRLAGAVSHNVSVKQQQAATPPPALLGAVKSRLRDKLEGTAGEAAATTPVTVADTAVTAAPRGQIRYLPMSEVLSDAQLAAVRGLKMPGVALEQRPVREYPAGLEVASIVGMVGFENFGLMGAEHLLDDELKSGGGLIRYVRDSAGRPLWINPGQVRPATHGRDVRLSIDLEIQRMCHDELWRGIEAADAAGGRLVAVDVRTGEILAMVDLLREVEGYVDYPWEDPKHPGSSTSLLERGDRYRAIKDDPKRREHPAAGRNRIVEDVYEPGSTFKAFVWSVITELGLARPDEVFDTEGGRWRTGYGRPIEDVTRRQTMTWREVLINSSNIGMVKAAERMSYRQLHDAVRRFGFGQQTFIGLPGEASGLVTPMSKWSKYSQTSVAYGHEVAATPLQMVRAFSAFCRTGDLAGTIPALTVRAVDPDGSDQTVLYRVVPAWVAKETRETLRGVTDNMETKLAALEQQERAWKYEIFGKSGTAKIPLGAAPEGKRQPLASRGYFINQYNSSFIAGGPTEEPRIAMVVVIDDPGPELVRTKRHYGASTAGPVARRAMERVLTYLAVPPSNVVAAGEMNGD
jgi:cell division protein FtsI/penicillin-binding protein 2